MLRLIVDKGQKLKCVNHVEFMGRIIVEIGEICKVSLVSGDNLTIQTRYGVMKGTLSEVAEHFTLIHNSEENPKKEECYNSNTCSKEWDDDEFWNEEYDDEEEEYEVERKEYTMFLGDYRGNPIGVGDIAEVVSDMTIDKCCIHHFKIGTKVIVDKVNFVDGYITAHECRYAGKTQILPSHHVKKIQ